MKMIVCPEERESVQSEISLVAVSRGLWSSASEIWDLKQWKKLYTIPHPVSVLFPGARYCVVNFYRSIRVEMPLGGRVTWDCMDEGEVPGYANKVFYVSDSEVLVAFSETPRKVAALYSIDGKLKRLIADEYGGGWKYTFSPATKHLVSEFHAWVTCYDTNSGDIVFMRHSSDLSGSTVHNVFLSYDGKFLATKEEDKVVIWRFPEMVIHSVFVGRRFLPTISPTGKYLVLTDFLKPVARVYHIASGTMLGEFSSETGWSPGAFFANENTFYLWFNRERGLDMYRVTIHETAPPSWDFAGVIPWVKRD